MQHDGVDNVIQPNQVVQPLDVEQPPDVVQQLDDVQHVDDEMPSVSDDETLEKHRYSEHLAAKEKKVSVYTVIIIF